MKALIFHPDISDDIMPSYQWYQEQTDGLGDSFISELEKAYEAIVYMPQTWSPFKYGFKRYILTRFPFSVIYKEEEESILIIAIMHHSRNPNYWLERIKI
ncbi:MAG: type II toxin-antitoxin system RelE/ParE family toxin [Campylobacterales bacterium]|nr:type II toxin-antitoxin system RelE/ParE family toxin [Campylobacterales bacterium]